MITRVIRTQAMIQAVRSDARGPGSAVRAGIIRLFAGVLLLAPAPHLWQNRAPVARGVPHVRHVAVPRGAPQAAQKFPLAGAPQREHVAELVAVTPAPS